MKRIILIACLFCATLVSAQAYEGRGDQKVQIGASFQDGATGIIGTYDYGLGDNFSIGLGAAYALGTDDLIDPDFDERAMLALRFNAPIGNVLNIDPMFDLYPGLAFTTKHFGGHVGARYFFTDGFGLYTEAAFPFAKYKTEDLTPEESLYNQFNISIGTSFNF
ncbi:DUF6646 family protein [Nonlabens xiamenensis]|uniref:DUF6646 family protein n=1 Tax=Nonlabens xiamenensis TaxID=2341043 RepID=UPI000F610944|nr:DUF6646 family protein [Nonlabens xiamenensis]